VQNPVAEASACVCGDDTLNPRYTIECEADPQGTASFITAIPTDVPAVLSAVNIHQDLRGEPGATVFVHVFCTKQGAQTPYSARDRPLVTMTPTLTDENDDTCVTLPLPSPLVLTTACEVLWLEMETIGNEGVVAVVDECADGEPTGLTTWIASDDCAVHYPVNLGEAGLAADIVMGATRTFYMCFIGCFCLFIYLFCIFVFLFYS